MTEVLTRPVRPGIELESSLAAEASAIEGVLASPEAFTAAFTDLVEDIDTAYNSLSTLDQDNLNAFSFDKDRGKSDNGTHMQKPPTR